MTLRAVWVHLSAVVAEQFTQTDPMPYGSGHAYEASYVYGRNNPLMYTDPSGLRGGLPGCPYSANPIASNQPEMLAWRTQILIPAPGSLPLRTVPPRTTPPPSPTTLVPATSRPRPTTTRPRPTTTAVEDDETTTTQQKDCEANRRGCENSAYVEKNKQARNCARKRTPQGQAACYANVANEYSRALAGCQREYDNCVASGGKPRP
jgi:hypothetical protein